MTLCNNERFLLMITGMAALTGIIAVNLANGEIQFAVIGAVAGVILSCFAVHFIIRKAGHTGDPLFLPVTVMLLGIGLTIVFRLKPALFFYQALWSVVGLFAFTGTIFLFQRVERLAEYKYLCGLLGILLLLTAIVFGVDIGGNKNWVIIGPVRFQPSEFAKLFIVLFLAAYLDERKEVLSLTTDRYGPIALPPLRFIAPLIVVWGLAMGVFILQRDLGSALLYFGTALVMFYMASGRLQYVLAGACLFLVGALTCYYLYPHVQVRVDIWLNPWTDPSGKAYQIVQSLFALGSGGILGTGLTYGFPGMIPEVHTDFVFAAIGEEMGLLGSAAVLLFYIVLISRAFKVAIASSKSLEALLAGGLSVALALQVFIIVGGVTKFFPLTGITLPFVSYGGSSMVANFIFLGMLFAMSEKRPDNA